MYQRIVEGMRSELKFENLLKLFVLSARKGLGFKRAGVFLLEDDGKHAYLAMGTSVKGTFEKNKDRIPIVPRRGENPISDVTNGYLKYFLTNNLRRRITQRNKYRVLVFNNAVVPLEVGKGRIIGCLAVDNLFKNRPITKSDVSSLMNYATQIGLAIESFRAHQRMLNLTLTDFMTGLYNRRYYDQALSQEIKRCQRYGRSFSLLLVDIDRFKRINDTYGHPAGDEIIRQIAFILRASLRSLDLVARVGGEEFAVILPETPPQNLSVVVKRLLREVSGANPAVSAMAEKGENVTVSIGLATYKSGNTNALAMMKLADKSLYQAKQSGRNRGGDLKMIQAQARQKRRFN